MKLEDAVILRIEQLCLERNMTYLKQAVFRKAL